MNMAMGCIIHSSGPQAGDPCSSSNSVITNRRQDYAYPWSFTKKCTLFISTHQGGYAVAQLVEALRYKSEGRGFDSQWCHYNFSLT